MTDKSARERLKQLAEKGNERFYVCLHAGTEHSCPYDRGVLVRPDVVLSLLRQLEEAESVLPELRAWVKSRRDAPDVTTLGLIEHWIDQRERRAQLVKGKAAKGMVEP